MLTRRAFTVGVAASFAALFLHPFSGCGGQGVPSASTPGRLLKAGKLPTIGNATSLAVFDDGGISAAGLGANGLLGDGRTAHHFADRKSVV